MSGLVSEKISQSPQSAYGTLTQGLALYSGRLQLIIGKSLARVELILGRVKTLGRTHSWQTAMPQLELEIAVVS